MMRSVQSRQSIRNLGLSLIIVSVLSAPSVWGQTQSLAQPQDWKTRVIKLEFKDQSFADITRLLQEKTGISIIADGEPLRQTASLNLQGTVSQTLDQIADLFDYEWKTSQSGIVLMTKRFRNPDERPQANLLELRRAAHDIRRALETIPIDPERSLSECFGALAQTFSSQQAETLQNGRPLRIGDLAPFQKILAMKAIYTNMLDQPLQKWQTLSGQLNGAAKATVGLEETEAWLDLQGTQKQKNLTLLYRVPSEITWSAGLLFLKWQPLLRAPKGN